MTKEQYCVMKLSPNNPLMAQSLSADLLMALKADQGGSIITLSNGATVYFI